MQTMVQGSLIGFDEAGHGRPLVLVHGYPFDRNMWEHQLSGLSDVAHVIALDLWGFGESAPVEQASIGTYADQVRGLLDGRGITEPVVIGGLSMGGYIVFEFFRRYRDRVAGVILANTKSGPDSQEGKAGRDKSAALARENGAGAISAQMLPKMLAPKTYQTNPQLVEQVGQMMTRQTVEGIVAALMAMRDRPDSTPTLAEIRQPSVVIAGADDQLFPQSEFQNMAKALRDGKLVTLPDAGHVSNMEKPNLFNDAVRELLKRVK